MPPSLDEPSPTAPVRLTLCGWQHPEARPRITEQAWEVREEELDRVRSLQSERARQEQLLDEELKEVRDDGVEPGQANPNK